MKAVAIVAAVVVLAALVVLATLRRGDARRGAGVLSRETRKRDRSPKVADTALAVTGREIEKAAVVSRSQALEAATMLPAVPFAPPDPEQLGVTRRHFFNVGSVALMGVSVSTFGAACIAFLWPKLGGGFGSKVSVGKLDDIKAAIRANNGFYYLAEGRTWITSYPADGLAKAKKIYAAPVLNGLQGGITALYQKCPHLGCRVPECKSSQWFECPCHGSQYNRVGEKKGGPAPRGMDRFGVSIDAGGNVTIDTSQVFQGPPIGTNTTGQEAEGPHCIGGGEGKH
jgi:cytochrome b6-f complex iron-sulfur subunit